jgi:hypothetical protein
MKKTVSELARLLGDRFERSANSTCSSPFVKSKLMRPHNDTRCLMISPSNQMISRGVPESLSETEKHALPYFLLPLSGRQRRMDCNSCTAKADEL